jgi:hypothetical protein
MFSMTMIEPPATLPIPIASPPIDITVSPTPAVSGEEEGDQHREESSARR